MVSISTVRDNDQVEDLQADSWFAHKLTNCLCSFRLFGAPHVSIAGYEKDAFIYIAKNAIVISKTAIVICPGLFEKCSICECCGCDY